MPLWQLLTSDEDTFIDIDCLRTENDVDLLLYAIVKWCARRESRKDILDMDPDMELDYKKMVDGLDAQEKACAGVEEHEKEVEAFKAKIQATAETMLQMQIAKNGPGWEHSEPGKANAKTVEEWKNGKIAVKEKAHRLLMDEDYRVTDSLKELSRTMYYKARTAFMRYLKKTPLPPPGVARQSPGATSATLPPMSVDDPLLKELEDLCSSECGGTPALPPTVPVLNAEVCFAHVLTCMHIA